MPGPGRLAGRGVPTGAAPMPIRAAAHPLLVPSRIAAIAAAELFDFATFTIMVGRHGIARELNPIVAHGFAGFGIPMVLLMKLALVVLLASIIVVLDLSRPAGRSIPWMAPAIAVLAVVAGLVGGVSNILAT
jgi:hypothetical protein